jgi:glutamate racemase
MKIGVFDSGVGGLSVLAAIRRALPQVDLAYCCDNLNFPYGTKSDAEVLACASHVALRFAEAAAMDVLVVACNTASTIVLPSLRQKLSIPVVGVVPAIKPAAQASISKVIGILATPATIRRPYLDDLIQEFASDCEVVRVGSSRMVVMAEEKLRGKPIADLEIRQEVDEIIKGSGRGLDQLVLGCTHFPLLLDELRRVIPQSVHFVDSGAAVAARVAAIIASIIASTVSSTVSSTDNARLEAQTKSQADRTPTITGFCSGDPTTLGLDSLGLGDLSRLVLRPLP